LVASTVAAISTSDLIAAVSVIVAVGAAVGAPIVSYQTTKRRNSGRVSVSEASVLWQQSQEMRSMLLAEKEKAEEQRDKLVNAYSAEIIPSLAQLNTAVKDLAAASAQGLVILRRLEKRDRDP
jgi:hypothetical protein